MVQLVVIGLVVYIFARGGANPIAKKDFNGILHQVIENFIYNTWHALSCNFIFIMYRNILQCCIEIHTLKF